MLPTPVTGELKQVRKSTGQTNKKKALMIAVEMERAVMGRIQAGTDKAQKAKAIFAEVVEEVERETFNVLAARKYVARLLEVATGEDMTQFTVESWFAEWLRRKARDSSKATMARYNAHLNAFLRWIGPERSKKPLESVITQDVRTWREKIQDEGRTAKTVSDYVKDVGAAYRAAIREGLVAFNPCTALEALDMSDSLDRKPFDLEEIKRLIDAGPCDEWKGLILVAAFTGLRLSDAARLSWDAVDLEKKRISLMPNKTRRKRRMVSIPLQPDLLEFLESFPVHDDTPGAFVLPTLALMPVQTRKGLSAAFVSIMEAADVDRRYGLLQRQARWRRRPVMRPRGRNRRTTHDQAHHPPARPRDGGGVGVGGNGGGVELR